MVLAVSEEGEVRLCIARDVFAIGNFGEVLLVVLHVNVFENDIAGHLLVEGCLIALVGGVDKFRPEVYLEGGLKKERDVVKQEAEGEVAELMLHEGSMVKVVGPQVLLRLLQQLLRL